LKQTSSVEKPSLARRPRLLGGQHRLAGARATDDRRTPNAAQGAQELVLRGRQLDDVGMAGCDLVPQHRADLERLDHRRAQQLDAVSTGRIGAGGARPVIEGAVEESLEFEAAVGRVGERRLIGDEIRVGVRPEDVETEASAHRIEVDIGEGARHDH
jgi:hypothetical protein